MEPEEKNYQVRLVTEEEPQRTDSKPENRIAATLLDRPERFDEDPLEHLPAAYNPMTVLPIVTFVLLCIAGAEVLLIVRLITAETLLLKAGCGLLLLIGIFGIVALVHSVFRRLHERKEAHSAYILSAVIMSAGILLGLIIGIMESF